MFFVCRDGCLFGEHIHGEIVCTLELRFDVAHTQSHICASAWYPARQRACHRSNTQGSSVSGQEQAQRREPPFSQRCEYSLGGAQLRGYPPSTPKNDHSAGRAYPRDLRARTLQASDHWHPPGASPTHVPHASASFPAKAPPKNYFGSAIFPRFSTGLTTSTRK